MSGPFRRVGLTSGCLCISLFGRPDFLMMSTNDRTIKEDHAHGWVFAAALVEKTLPDITSRHHCAAIYQGPNLEGTARHVALF